MRSFIFGLALAVAIVPWVQVQAADPDSSKKAEQIATILQQSGQLKDYRVGVKYEDGVASLMGSVTSPEQKQIAEQLARTCEGVSHVVSRLVVESATQQVSPKRDLNIQAASNPAEAVQQARQVQQLRRQPRQQPRQQPEGFAQRRTPRSNMPVPYARAGNPNQRPGVQPAAYNRQAQYFPGNGMGGGMGPAPMRPQGPVAAGQAVNYDNPQMPGYAWPSYAASPNYAAITYPKQYSASAWPYIGPFYPYPQVPLGWRKVALEWDDGWWNLDFSD
jgi:hypothetical protein